MKDGWKTYRLGYLGTFFGGVTNIKPQDYGYGTPFLTYKNVFKNSKVDVNELELMNVKPQDIQKRSAIYGDIFFTASSETPDEVAMSSVLLDNVLDLTYNGFCKRLRLSDFRTLMPEFARYLFRGKPFRESVCQVATGDIRFNISQESLGNISVDLPSLAEQKHIAQILGSLDDKIELNRRINDNLERQAQAIFKSWFVDFEPFGGKMPSDWKKGCFGDISHVISGKRPTIREPLISATAKIPLIGASSVMGFTDDVLYAERILITGRVGTHGVIQRYSRPCWPSDNTLVIKSDYYEFAYQQLCCMDFHNMNRGSTQPLITQTDLKNVSVDIPDGTILIEFEDLVGALMKQFESNVIESEHLADMRDTLLPKLMSGELSVEGAEQQL